MSALRRGGKCYRCGMFLPEGSEVQWEEGPDHRNHFFHSGRCPSPPAASPSASTTSPTTPPVAPTPSPSTGGDGLVSVSVERTLLLPDGTPIVAHFQTREERGTYVPMAHRLTEDVDRVLEAWEKRLADRFSPAERKRPRTGVEKERERLARVRAGEEA